MSALGVLQVITKLDVGGAQQTVYEIVRHLDPSFATAVVAGVDPGDGGSVEGAIRQHAEVILVPTLMRRIHPVNDVLSVLRLWSLFRERRPDVVHTHSSKAGIIGRVAAWCARVPVRVHTVHGWSFRDGQGRVTRTAYEMLERAVAKLTSAIFVVSVADREIGLRLKIGTDAQYVVVPTPVDLTTCRSVLDQREARDRISIGHEAFVVGWIGRLSWPKEPDVFVRAVASVAGAVGVVAGAGPLRNAATALAVELGAQDRITFLGLREDVADLLGAFDVFVLASQSEGLPRSILEAMAAGVPVIASNVGGVPEVAIDGVNAVLIPPGDANVLAQAIRDVRDGVIDGGALARVAAVDVARYDSAAIVRRIDLEYRRLHDAVRRD